MCTQVSTHIYFLAVSAGITQILVYGSSLPEKELGLLRDTADSRTGVGIYKVNLEHLVVPKRKKVLKKSIIMSTGHRRK